MVGTKIFVLYVNFEKHSFSSVLLLQGNCGDNLVCGSEKVFKNES